MNSQWQAVNSLISCYHHLTLRAKCQPDQVRTGNYDLCFAAMRSYSHNASPAA